MLPPTGAHICIRFTRLEDYLRSPSVRESALDAIAPDVSMYSPEADAAWNAFCEAFRAYVAGRNTFVCYSGMLCAVIGGHEVELPLVKGTWRTAGAKDKRHITKWGLKAAIGQRVRRGAGAVKYLNVAERKAANGLEAADCLAAVERAKTRLRERVFRRVNTLCNEASRFVTCEQPGCTVIHSLGMMIAYHTLASTRRDDEPIAHVRCENHAPETISCRSCGRLYALEDVTSLSRLVADGRRREGHATLTPAMIAAMDYLISRPDALAPGQAAAPVVSYRSSNGGSLTALCARCINRALDGTTNGYLELPRTMHLHPDGVYGVSPPPPPPDRDLLDYTTNVLDAARVNGRRAFACVGGDGELVRLDLASALHNQLYGVELEVESSLPSRTILDAFPRAEDGGQLVIAKKDSSLDRRRGKELVTLPMTIDAQKLFWRGLEHASVKGKLASYRNTNGRCGCHIHIGLSTLAATQAAVIAYLVAHKGNASLTDLVARRRYSSYAKQIALAKGVSAERLAYEVTTLGHYGAASYSRHGTLEVRVYKGTSLYNGLLIYLEHAESLVAYVKDCVPMTQVDLPADADVGEAKHYLAWLKTQAGFERLKRHLSIGESGGMSPPWILESPQSPVQALSLQEDEAEAEADAPL